MSYATVDELAAALRIRPTPENTPLLDACLAAAAEEIDGFLDRGTVVWPEPVPASVNRCNVNRAAEWYKAADSAGGAMGFDQVGVMPPTAGFARHGTMIRRWRLHWGVG